MTLAHAFIGVFIGAFLGSNYKKEKKVYIYTAAILGSIVPDIDIPYVLFVNPLAEHRTLITHSIFTYFFAFVICIAIIRAVRTKGENFSTQTNLAFFAGAVFHLFADLLVDKVYLFRPFSSMPVMLRLFPLDKNKGFLGYLKSPFMLLEISIILAAIIVLIKDYKDFKKGLRIISALLGIILVVAVICLIPFLTKFN